MVSLLRCVVVCCSVLQCVAVCCSVLQCVAVCSSAWQCVAACCIVLQRVAACVTSACQCATMKQIFDCIVHRCMDVRMCGYVGVGGDDSEWLVGGCMGVRVCACGGGGVRYVVCGVGVSLEEFEIVCSGVWVCG